ncbi:hypothetical protein J3R82DRAFT_7064 [Butyriboletus roseoflavus]|nr:hypothetical protein J3R82DRAFT_7064 [Butyriboletus roseoflavus]
MSSPFPSRPFSPAVTHNGARTSTDSEPSTSAFPVNGTAHHDDTDQDQDLDVDPLERLQRQLARERAEREDLATQYRNLLAKLTAMRTTLGNKLKQDAEELDRRELHIQTLTAQNEDMSATVETLKTELMASHADNERTARELDSLRNRDLSESVASEHALRETLAELERCRLERDEWERGAMQERLLVEEARAIAEALRRELDVEREVRQREGEVLDAAKETAANLQSVLEDFQTAREHELHQAVKGYKTQLDDATLSLADFKRRALDAEIQLEDNKNNASRTSELEQDVKEKNLLIGKLRHEAVIMNEHLIEALRRLRKSSSDTNVDRRLVSNVLLSFLSTPRPDPKRFEMLALLGTILGWGDTERERAGLIKNLGTVPSAGATGHGASGGSGLFWGRGINGAASPSKSKNMELEKTDETESFSRLWVEFLLTEANQGESQSQPGSQTSPSKLLSHTSMPSSPSHSPNRITLSSPSNGTAPPTGSKGMRRLGSWTPLGGAAAISLPTLSLSPPPSRKGKEKEVIP